MLSVTTPVFDDVRDVLPKVAENHFFSFVVHTSYSAL